MDRVGRSTGGPTPDGPVHQVQNDEGRQRDERGAISVWFAIASLVMIILVGMTIDVGGKVHAQQQARNAAA